MVSSEDALVMAMGVATHRPDLSECGRQASVEAFFGLTLNAVSSQSVGHHFYLWQSGLRPWTTPRARVLNLGGGGSKQGAKRLRSDRRRVLQRNRRIQIITRCV